MTGKLKAAWRSQPYLGEIMAVSQTGLVICRLAGAPPKHPGSSLPQGAKHPPGATPPLLRSLVAEAFAVNHLASMSSRRLRCT